MARMIRRQIVIDAERDAALDKLAKARGVSRSELIRQALDDLLTAGEEDLKRQQAWDELLEMWRNAPAREGLVVDGKRTWKREDLYGDRYPR